jgi:hypothetical protein
MVSNRPHTHPYPLLATHRLYKLYFDTGKGGERGISEPERRLEEQ